MWQCKDLSAAGNKFSTGLVDVNCVNSLLHEGLRTFLVCVSKASKTSTAGINAHTGLCDIAQLCTNDVCRDQKTPFGRPSCIV